MTDHAHSDADELATEAHAPLDLSALYKGFYATLCIFVRRRFGSGPPEPEDVAQIAFAQLASHPDPNSIEKPKAFLYRTACNVVLDARKREPVTARILTDFFTLNGGATSADSDAGRVIEGRESLAAVNAAIEALDPRRRDVLIMHSIHDLSCAEIGRRLGISPTRVIQLYAQAIEACARALRDDGEGG